MSIVNGNAKSKAAIDGRAGRTRIFCDPVPTASKDDLRRMLADASANMPASADSTAAVRMARGERRS